MDRTTIEETPDGPIVHVNNGSKVLAVAHMDAVGFTKPKCTKKTVTATQLDDRLGVAIILDLLPALGINVDVLLADSEEIGRTTVRYHPFDDDHPYKWMVEFDRKGVDVVTYDYTEKPWEKALKDAGFKLGRGSFSDISALDDLKICGVNVGVAYYQPHTKACNCVLPSTLANVAKFHKFYLQHQNTLFDYDEERCVPEWKKNWKKNWNKNWNGKRWGQSRLYTGWGDNDGYRLEDEYDKHPDGVWRRKPALIPAETEPLPEVTPSHWLDICPNCDDPVGLEDWYCPTCKGDLEALAQYVDMRQIGFHI